jgi:hypothetical protein
MDASARETMKDAAKCDKHCELQNPVSQLKSERRVRKTLPCVYCFEHICQCLFYTFIDSFIHSFIHSCVFLCVCVCVCVYRALMIPKFGYHSVGRKYFLMLLYNIIFLHLLIKLQSCMDSFLFYKGY